MAHESPCSVQPATKPVELERHPDDGRSSATRCEDSARHPLSSRSGTNEEETGLGQDARRLPPVGNEPHHFNRRSARSSARHVTGDGKGRARIRAARLEEHSWIDLASSCVGSAQQVERSIFERQARRERREGSARSRCCGQFSTDKPRNRRKPRSRKCLERNRHGCQRGERQARR